jgi:hypothetical protein
VRSQEDQVYEALSYTWATENGECKRSSHIKCDGTKLFVTKNCRLALRYLRKEDASRLLWVDAICINQKDDKERGHQVGMMRDVYSKATEVLVWLGESSKDVGTPDPASQMSDAEALNSMPRSVNQGPIPVSDLFFDYFHRMIVQMRRLRSLGQPPTSSPLHQNLLSQVYERSFGGMNTDLRRGFKDFVRRRWWSRVWVVQEVAVAKSATLICSARAIKYADFFDWHDMLRFDDHTPKAFKVWNHLYPALNHLRAVYNAQSEHSSPMQVLAWSRHLTASDPRDNIFGMLGLSDKFKSLLPLPDYSKSTTQVFTEVAKRHLSQTKSLTLLEYASRIASRIGHPSWVPHWSEPPVIAAWTDLPKSASKKSKAIFEISSDDQELRLQGLQVDRVKKFPPPDLEAFRSRTYESRVKSYYDSCNVGFSLTSYPTDEPVKEALWRTFCWNMDRQGDHLSSAPGDSFDEWYHILTSTKTVEENREQMHIQQNDFESHINNTSPLCTTEKGYLAAVPDTTEVGDCIAVLAGGDFPFILRPTGDHYCLIGPCYVHGIMSGEAFPDNLDELKWFSIR